jgi:hypothetical protein
MLLPAPSNQNLWLPHGKSMLSASAPTTEFSHGLPIELEKEADAELFDAFLLSELRFRICVTICGSPGTLIHSSFLGDKVLEKPSNPTV